MVNDTPVPAGYSRTAGMLAFNQQRKQDSRGKLLAAAIRLFSRDGYGAVAIEDITQEAGVSRITFYRHFASKGALAVELFHQASAEGAPRMLAITSRDWRDRDTVVQWLHDFFDGDREIGGILRILSQANVEDAGFSKQIQPFLVQLIGSLGKAIPAFDVTPGEASDRQRWVKAWLLVYTIFDQSNHSAIDAGIARDPLMIEVLADSFLNFVLNNDRAG